MRNEKKNERLVVVDDDSIICELLTAYFRPRGYEVVTFPDAEELTFLKLDLQEVEYWGTPHSPVFRIVDFVRNITGDENPQDVVYEKVDLSQ